eukprot:6169472-Pleurochrysis_carterae.AAC.1
MAKAAYKTNQLTIASRDDATIRRAWRGRRVIPVASAGHRSLLHTGRPQPPTVSFRAAGSAGLKETDPTQRVPLAQAVTLVRMLRRTTISSCAAAWQRGQARQRTFAASHLLSSAECGQLAMRATASFKSVQSRGSVFMLAARAMSTRRARAANHKAHVGPQVTLQELVEYVKSMAGPSSEPKVIEATSADGLSRTSKGNVKRDVPQLNRLLVRLWQHKQSDLAWRLYTRLQERGIELDAATYGQFLKAIGGIGHAPIAERADVVARHMREKGLYDPTNPLDVMPMITAKSNSGQFEAATEVFEEARARG